MRSFLCQVSYSGSTLQLGGELRSCSVDDIKAVGNLFLAPKIDGDGVDDSKAGTACRLLNVDSLPPPLSLHLFLFRHPNVYRTLEIFLVNAHEYD